MKIKSEKNCGTFTFFISAKKKRRRDQWQGVTGVVTGLVLHLVTGGGGGALGDPASTHAGPSKHACTPSPTPCCCLVSVPPPSLCLLRQAACIGLVVSHLECEDLSTFNLFIISKECASNVHLKPSLANYYPYVSAS